MPGHSVGSTTSFDPDSDNSFATADIKPTAVAIAVDYIAAVTILGADEPGAHSRLAVRPDIASNFTIVPRLANPRQPGSAGNHALVPYLPGSTTRLPSCALIFQLLPS